MFSKTKSRKAEKSIVIFALLILAIVLASFSSDEKTFNNAKDWIPEGFDTRSTVLLVQNIKGPGNERAQKVWEKVIVDMKAVMKAGYPYKYEFASQDDIKSSAKYTDKDTYRYVLVPDFAYGTSLGATGTDWKHDDFIYDRKLDKSYAYTKHASSNPLMVFKPAVATIVKYLKELK